MVGSSQRQGDIDQKRIEQGIASLRLLKESIKSHKKQINHLFNDEKKTEKITNWLEKVENHLKINGSIPNLHIAFEHQGIGFLLSEDKSVRQYILDVRDLFDI